MGIPGSGNQWGRGTRRGQTPKGKSLSAQPLAQPGGGLRGAEPGARVGWEGSRLPALPTMLMPRAVPSAPPLRLQGHRVSLLSLPSIRPPPSPSASPSTPRPVSSPEPRSPQKQQTQETARPSGQCASGQRGRRDRAAPWRPDSAWEEDGVREGGSSRRTSLCPLTPGRAPRSPPPLQDQAPKSRGLLPPRLDVQAQRWKTLKGPFFAR